MRRAGNSQRQAELCAGMGGLQNRRWLQRQMAYALLQNGLPVRHCAYQFSASRFQPGNRSIDRHLAVRR